MIQNMQTAIPIQTAPEKRELKSLSALRLLALVELVLGIVFILLEGIADGVIINTGYFHRGLPCTFGTGVWVGVLGVINGVFGLVAFRSSYGNRAFMTTHFVLSIIGAVADGALLILVSVCLADMPHALYQSPHDRSLPEAAYHAQRGIVALESFLVIFGIVHMISCILSAAFICRNWCGGPSSKTVTVIYLPQPDAAAAKDGTPIAVPAGTQLVFVPAINQPAAH